MISTTAACSKTLLMRDCGAGRGGISCELRGCVGAGIKAEVEDEGEFAFFCFMDEFV